MTRTFYALSLFGLAAASPALAAGRGPVPPASFLNYHAASVHELAQEVSLDPAVRGRLARHFHVTPQQMTRYVRRNLVLTRLTSPGVYRVACVRANGTEYWVRERLASGTPIFASRATGRPILKLACGNPMVSALPPETRVADSRNVFTAPALSATPVGTKVALAAPALTPAAFLPAGFTAETPLAPPVIRTAGNLQSLVPALGRAGGSNLGSVLGTLAGIGGAVAVFGGGGGSNGTPFVPAVPILPTTGPTTSPVPEASPALSLGLLLLAGGGALALRRKRPAR